MCIGWPQLDQSATLHDVIAVDTARGSNAWPKSLLKDDRLGLTSSGLENTMIAKQHDFEALGQCTWIRLAQLVPDTSPTALENHCMQASQVAQAIV